MIEVGDINTKLLAHDIIIYVEQLHIETQKKKHANFQK